MPQKQRVKSNSSQNSSGGSRKRTLKKKTSKKWPLARKAAGAAIGGLANLTLTALKKKLGLNTELHYFDNTPALITVSTTLNNFFDPCVIAQGTTDTTRVGNSVRIDSIDFRFQLKSVATSTQEQDSLIRIIIVNWGKAPTASRGANFIVAATGNILAPYSITGAAQGVHVIYDKMFCLGADSSMVGGTGFSPGSPTSIYEEWVWRPAAHHIQWTQTDTTGVEANAVSGWIGVWMMVDGNAGSGPAANCWARVRFVDN